MVHAELNCILNYGGSLKDLEGSTLYVTIFPCESCAKVIAQLNISQVIYLEEYHRVEHMEASKIILDKCGIPYISYYD